MLYRSRKRKPCCQIIFCISKVLIKLFTAASIRIPAQCKSKNLILWARSIYIPLRISCQDVMYRGGSSLRNGSATSPEYRKAVKPRAALMEQLSQRLSKEGYALAEALRAQPAIAQCEEPASRFQYGFSAGLNAQREAREQAQQKGI